MRLSKKSKLEARYSEPWIFKRCWLIRIIDGDTLVLFVDQGFRNFTLQHIRFKDIDTPELNSRNRKERRKAILVGRYVQGLTAPYELFRPNPQGEYLSLITWFDKTVARYVGDIILPDGENLSQILLEKGYAKRVRRRK